MMMLRVALSTNAVSVQLSDSTGCMCVCVNDRSVEAAAMLHKEAGDYGKAADLIEQASTMYLEHGTQDTAAVMLDRAGK